jgi:hypothetical protein
MKRIIITLTNIMLVVLAFGQTIYKNGEIRLSPRLLNYQGFLTDTLGNPITNPSVSMTFALFDAASSGNQKWTETQSTVNVSKGIFHVLLGSVTPIPDSVFNNTGRWLELSVSGQTLAPRTRIVSVPFAYSSTLSDTAIYARSSAPDNKWTYLISDVADTTLQTGGLWGLARTGNILFGNADSTHVNFGIACTTGESGQNNKYCTISGGHNNLAKVGEATVGGGSSNWAMGYQSFIGGGGNNRAGGSHNTIAGGRFNHTDQNGSTVGGDVLM